MKREAHFTQGSYHKQELIREFLSYDVQIPELCVLNPVNNLGTLDLSLVSTLHWSRQYELAWAIDVANLQKDDLVLDAGCAYSTTKYAAAKRCRKVTGIDLSEDYLKKAKKGCDIIGVKNVELEISDIADYKSWNKFDKIFCLSVLEHEPREENRYKCIENMMSLLKPRGLLILSYDIVEEIKPDMDFYIDQKVSDKILDMLGHEKIYHGDAKVLGNIAGNLLATVCCVYEKPR